MSWSSGLNRATRLPQLKPWQRFDWRSCIQSQIYRDWGTFYSSRQMIRTALAALGRAVALCKSPEPHPKQMSCLAKSCQGMDIGVCVGDYKALFKRSRCHRELARPDLAYTDAQRAEQALATVQRDQPQSLMTADIAAEQGAALYDMNAFEMAFITLHNAEQQFAEKHQQKRFQMMENKTRAVFDDTLGDSLHSFMEEHASTLKEAARQRQELADHVSRPLWKVLSEQQECDVQSIPERPSVSLTPLERARRRQNETRYNYTYMGRDTVDVLMLRHLQQDHHFLDPHKLGSTPYLRQLSSDSYAVVRRFMKMLHAKNPLYNRQYVQHLGERERRRRRECVFYLEHRTRRECLQMLREVRARRRAGDVEKLSDYVEDIMSGYIGAKTHRTLPWKWEFLNDVYNILALAHMDRCALPLNVDFLEPKNRYLLYLLRPERFQDMTVNFGSRKAYPETDWEQRVNSQINQKLEQLEDRLHHSRYAIERAYLLFEMARCHFKEARYDKCLLISRRAFNQARSCNSLVWRFNSIFLVCQVHALLNRFERLKESLAKASLLAQDLRALHLVAFIAICINVNDYDMALRRMRQSEAYVRKSRVRSANSSGHSSVSATTLSGQSTLSIIPENSVQD